MSLYAGATLKLIVKCFPRQHPADLIIKLTTQINPSQKKLIKIRVHNFINNFARAQGQISAERLAAQVCWVRHKDAAMAPRAERCAPGAGPSHLP